RAGIIRDWQNNPQSDTFVLLLSLAQSASGTNLTAASHVVFLHPMLAPAERAVGYEMQAGKMKRAIGRARRHGQRRDVVHVWRFVTADTLEQQITERHQGALWALEQERQ
ncbi:DNA repair protein rhp54 (RAD54 homolog 1), partial [Durusdinium trenchii]